MRRTPGQHMGDAGSAVVACGVWCAGRSSAVRGRGEHAAPDLVAAAINPRFRAPSALDLHA